MASAVQRAIRKGLVHPPGFIADNLHYETIMGSVAYGVSSDTSDMDVYGFAIPPKFMVFPHLDGEIFGFGRQKKRFEQWQEHHVDDEEARKQYDFQVFSIVKFFQLAMDNNPNIIDSLFTPRFAVLHTTAIGEMVRENRKLFLHKGAWHRFKGYAYSQLHKMENKEPEGKRRAIVEEFGYDVKFAYHVVRLLDEVEQILVTGDIDLQRNREQLKSIRRGEWEEPEIRKWAEAKEKQLEVAYHESKLQHKPDEAAIKKLLLECLEHHYGSLDAAVVVPDRAEHTLREIRDLLEKHYDVR
tara:strand:+ start:2717 stop:3610 length:894 start_codon:yes stop_codon:yes gene_type:complete